MSALSWLIQQPEAPKHKGREIRKLNADMPDEPRVQAHPRGPSASKLQRLRADCDAILECLKMEQLPRRKIEARLHMTRGRVRNAVNRLSGLGVIVYKRDVHGTGGKWFIERRKEHK
jgi:hypothetical protein